MFANITSNSAASTKAVAAAGPRSRGSARDAKLVPIGWRNWLASAALTIRSDQRAFVTSNLYSLVQAYLDPCCRPFAICAGRRVVGFTMYAFDREDQDFWIYRLMIDREWQGRGYGRAGLALLLDRLRRVPGCRTVLIGHHPANEVARRLYLDLGFKPSDRRVGTELVLEMRLDRPLPGPT
jgi:diamine N-acetyltransferase